MSLQDSPASPHHSPVAHPQVVCIATAEMLPQARVMARSLRLHEPDWGLELVLIGSATAARAHEGELPIVSVEQELELDAEELLARHPPAELTALLVPRLLLARVRSGSGPTIHLPPSSWILDRLSPLVASRNAHSVLLAPRTSQDPPADGLEPSILQLVGAGRVAPDLMAVDGSSRAASFLTWWIDRLDEIVGGPDGSTLGHSPANRHWVYRSLELACVRLDVTTLDDPGCNLSAWNLPEHTLDQTPEGIRVDGRWPLRLMSLPGFAPDHPFRLNPSASRVRLSRDPVLKSLSIRYAEELIAAGWADTTHRRDMGQTLANGVLFDEAMQSLFAVAYTVAAGVGDPLSPGGTDAFMTWLRGPARRGGRHGINRYLFHRVMRDRPDVIAAFPDLDGGDGPGLVAWSHSSGQTEMDIPEELMSCAPPEPAPAAVLADPAGVVAEPADRTPQPGGMSTTAGGDPALGVRVSGYLGNVLGLGAAARGYVQALGAAGVSLSTASVSLDHLRPPVELEREYGVHSFSDVVGDGGHGFELVCVNPDELPEFVGRLGSGYFQGTRIGVWGWETNRIPARWASAFELLDEIWVYSQFVAENIAAVANIPVVALPPPVTAGSPPATPIRLGVPEGFLFLFVFDYSSTVQRKNPVGLIEAFKRAFHPEEGPRLLVKTINAPFLPLAEEEVLWARDGRPDIHVVDRSLTTEEKDGLIAACDCYVSLHRSEGFGLTLAEAMAIGKPVIGTAYSGNVDFMNAENSFLVDYKLTRVGPDCQIYPAEGEWAEPSIEHAAELMRQVYNDPGSAARVGSQARADIDRTLSPETTGAAMRQRLQELASTRGVGPSGADRTNRNIPQA
jgi:Glycosyl transferases group 1